jgi:TetR/AcrR family transcriptional regulator, mexJK operon transcriptional repressor
MVQPAGFGSAGGATLGHKVAALKGGPVDMPAANPDRPRQARSRGRPKVEAVATIESELLEVALAEFLTHGYGGASVNRIVRAAGVSKTTVYSRFASKEQLFRAIMDSQIQRLSALSSLLFHRRRAGLEQGLIAYGNRMLEISLEGDLLNVNRLIYSESQRFPELGAAAAERSELGVRQISAFIAACAEADQVPCRDPTSVAEAFIFMLRGWYVNVMLSNRPIAEALRERWVRSAVHVLMAGREGW